ncbi:MAG TPA: PepSY-associated TM helix domain-containing protein [Steroidobacteraceae bacterium]
MKESLRQSMAWLHTWAGLTVGWILYAVFVTGTLSYFRPEISHWMRPELRDARERPDAIESGIRALRDRQPNSPRWVIVAPTAREPTMRIGWMVTTEPGQENRILRRFESILLNPQTGEELKARETAGGDFFYRFHFELSMNPLWGCWIVGCCAMFMLVAILSGIVTHRNIFKNFFTFRPNKGQRSWLDAHNIVGVLALPYHLMITYTGLITLMLTYMPWGVQASYGYDSGAFLAEAFPNPPQTNPTGRSSTLTDIEPLLEEASRQWGSGALPESVTIDHPGDAGARIQMQRTSVGRISSNDQTIIFDGVTGKMLAATGDEPGAMRTHSVLYGLHLAHFSSIALRWMFALCGLLGIAMVASGLVLWSVKRAPERVALGRTPFGHRLVEILNIGTVVGLPLGVAAYFWANRLLPIELADRSLWEVRCFFIAWTLSYIAAPWQAVRQAWRTHFTLGALLFGLLPLVNALTTNTHLGITLLHGPSVYAGFDLTMLAIAFMLALAAWYASREASVPQRVHGRTSARAPTTIETGSA